MREAKYVRKGSVIRNLETGHEEHCSSINAAKKRSRELQGKELGCGYVRVEDSPQTQKLKRFQRSGKSGHRRRDTEE